MFKFLYEGSVGNLLAPRLSDDQNLRHAVQTGDLERLEQLITKGVDTRQTYAGATLMHFAAMHNQVAAAERLLQLGLDVNAQGPEGNTPLHKAAHAGSKDMVDWLIAHGANVQLRNEHRQDPYDICPSVALRQHLLTYIFPQGEGESKDVVYGVGGSSEGWRPATVGGGQGGADAAAAAAPGAMTAQGGVSMYYGASGVEGVSPYGDTAALTTPTPVPPTTPTAVISGHAAPQAFRQTVLELGNGIRADGFVSSASNPLLSAKYGNVSATGGLAPPPPMMVAPPPPPPTGPLTSDSPLLTPTPLTDSSAGTPGTGVGAMGRRNPFAHGRYVHYNAATNSTAAAPGASTFGVPVAQARKPGALPTFMVPMAAAPAASSAAPYGGAAMPGAATTGGATTATPGAWGASEGTGATAAGTATPASPVVGLVSRLAGGSAARTGVEGAMPLTSGQVLQPALVPAAATPVTTSASTAAEEEVVLDGNGGESVAGPHTTFAPAAYGATAFGSTPAHGSANLYAGSVGGGGVQVAVAGGVEEHVVFDD